jgi:hypothetical protein
VIERVGDERLQLYLYHIPPVAQVSITLGLIERLISKYPGIVAGVKDSSGEWSNTKAMLDAFAKEGFDVFAGSEVFLLDNMRHGGKGCITATGNINPGRSQRLQELALRGRRAPAGRHQRHAQDRAEAADDPGAEGGGGALRQRPRVEDLPAAARRAHGQQEEDAHHRAQGRRASTCPACLRVKTALVTGAGRGIGRAAAEALAKSG